jgi:GR25 family glycosyltransferase involved in LPS biosynthesis
MIPIHVISLTRSPHRLQAFRAANSTIPFHHFAAIDGTARPRETWVAEGVLTPDNTYSEGAIGCAMSHVRLWQQCADSGEACHILEDDAILRNDFITTSEYFLQALVDWDIVCWGWNLDWPLAFWPTAGLPVARLMVDPYVIKAAQKQFQSEIVPTRLYRLMYMAGTASYSLSPGGAEKLLQRCVPFGATSLVVPTDPGHSVEWTNGGLDVELSRHYGDMGAFVSVQPLCVSSNELPLSTIRGEDLPASWESENANT